MSAMARHVMMKGVEVDEVERLGMEYNAWRIMLLVKEEGERKKEGVGGNLRHKKREVGRRWRRRSTFLYSHLIWLKLYFLREHLR